MPQDGAQQRKKKKPCGWGEELAPWWGEPVTIVITIVTPGFPAAIIHVIVVILPVAVIPTSATTHVRVHPIHVRAPSSSSIVGTRVWGQEGRTGRRSVVVPAPSSVPPIVVSAVHVVRGVVGPTPSSWGRVIVVSVVLPASQSVHLLHQLLATRVVT